MVIKDKDSDSVTIHKQSIVHSDGGLKAGRWQLASPVDRFAAFIIDYFIALLPFLYLVAAPFQRIMKESVLFDDNLRFAVTSIFIVVAVTLFILTYQTLCVWLWSATLGKYLFGLRVVHVWHEERISFSQSLYRAFYWSLSWLLFGIPFLAVFSNSKRRTICDRIADTIVIAKRRDRMASTPSINESAMVRGVFWASGIILALILIFEAIMSLSDWSKKSEVIASLEEKGLLCSAVSDMQAEFVEKYNRDTDRLTLALSLFATGAVDLDCLGAEVDYAPDTQENESTLYLAKSFVYSEEKELSDLYLDQICLLDDVSADCRLSRIIAAVANNDNQAVQDEVELVEGEPPLYFNVWLLQHQVLHDQYAEANKILQVLPEISALNDLRILAQTKIKWGLNSREQSNGIETVAYQMLGESGQLDLSTFMCFEKIWNQCEARAAISCQQFMKTVENDETLLQETKTALTYLKNWECNTSTVKSYEALMLLPFSQRMKNLISVLQIPNKDKTKTFIQKLVSEVDENFKFEALRRIVELKTDPEINDTVKNLWIESEISLAWHKLGESLLADYYQRKDYQSALEIANYLFDDRFKSTPVRIENAIMAAHKLGRDDLLRDFVKLYMNDKNIFDFVGQRLPASDNEDVQQVIKDVLKGDL